MHCKTLKKQMKNADIIDVSAKKTKCFVKSILLYYYIAVKPSLGLQAYWKDTRCMIFFQEK